VAQFAVSGLAAMLLLGVAAVYLFSHIARAEAIDDARTLTELVARSVVEPALNDGVMRGDPQALAQLDRAVRRGALGGDVVRVKLWSGDGTIVYSDERRLIGQRYPLQAAEVAAARTGEADAELSDLSSPENRFERQYGKLLEVYLPIRTPDGKRVLFEQYLEYSSVAASGRRVWREFAPALLAALVLLELVQLPLAWSLARRLRARDLERVELLQQAVDASDLERRRIAADLHDGLVQDLAGLAFELEAESKRGGDVGNAFHEAAESVRASVRQLRGLLVQIYPPSLQRAGLEAALADLLAPAAARGLKTTLHVDPGVLAPSVEALLYRGAQEALRNVVAHAEASSVDVRVERNGRRVSVIVADDGRGFDSDEAARRRTEGHLGLSLLSSLADDAGGTLSISRANGRGTRVCLEVPT
jgi:two-component system, NarL family, sensor kinase